MSEGMGYSPEINRIENLDKSFKDWQSRQVKPVMVYTVDLDWAKSKGLKIVAGPNMGVSQAAQFDIKETSFEELPLDWKDVEEINNLIDSKEPEKSRIRDLFAPKHY